MERNIHSRQYVLWGLFIFFLTMNNVLLAQSNPCDDDFKMNICISPEEVELICPDFCLEEPYEITAVYSLADNSSLCSNVEYWENCSYYYADAGFVSEDIAYIACDGKKCDTTIVHLALPPEIEMLDFIEVCNEKDSGLNMLNLNDFIPDDVGEGTWFNMLEDFDLSKNKIDFTGITPGEYEFFYLTDNNNNCGIPYIMLTVAVEENCEITQVWPGDVNNDGLVFMDDFLQWGKGYGLEHSPRLEQGTEWKAYPVLNWESSFDETHNHALADCNGDGYVNEHDVKAIDLHYELLHGKTTATTANDLPPLFFELDKDSLKEGTEISVRISLGTNEQKVKSLYGIAFSVNFNSEYVKPGTFKMAFDESWMGEEGQTMVSFIKEFPADGRVDVAMTGINHIDRSNGRGQVAKASFVLIDNIAGKTTGQSVPLSLWFNNIVATAIDAETVDIRHEDKEATIVTALAVVPPPVFHSEDLIAVYPNPAKHHLTLKVKDSKTKLKIVRLFDIQGKEVLMKITDGIIGNNFNIDLSDLNAGIYVLQMETGDAVLTEKLEIIK